MDITQVKGFDAKLYENLKTEYESVSGTKGGMQVPNARILALVSAGQSFADAVAQVRIDLPCLASPKAADAGPLPNLFTDALALLTEFANEQRKNSRDLRIGREEEAIKALKEQAKDIRDKSWAQFATGLIIGAVSITMGAVSLGMSSSALKTANAKGTEAGNQAAELTKQTQGTPKEDLAESMKAAQKLAYDQAYATAYHDSLSYANNRISALNGIGGGVSTLGQAIQQCATTQLDARIKEDEGKAEVIRQGIEMLKDLEQSFTALLQKVQSTMDAIQSNMNQTRTRILA